MFPIIITTCTSKKRILPDEDLCANNLPSGNQRYITEIWLKRLSYPRTNFGVEFLYCGRGFSLIIKTAKSLNTDFWIISAGLGLINSKEKIPSYNLTISNNSSNIKKKVSEPFDYTSWWLAINRGRKSLSELINNKLGDIFFLTLNQSYAMLIRNDLQKLSDTMISRLRIFGITNTNLFCKRLQIACMPYDLRINDPIRGIPGTCSDFAQRALYHFVTQIWHENKLSDANEHAKLVRNSLSEMVNPTVPNRMKLSDEDIIKIMLKYLSKGDYSSSQMLRILRDQENIACEQKRCKYILEKLKEEVVDVKNRQRLSNTQGTQM